MRGTREVLPRLRAAVRPTSPTHVQQPGAGTAVRRSPGRPFSVSVTWAGVSCAVADMLFSMTQRDSQSEVRLLLYELCVKLGFCLPPQDQSRLQAAPPVDVDSFTDAVFEAEGMDPDLDGQLRRRVRETVERHMRGWGDPLSTDGAAHGPGEG